MLLCSQVSKRTNFLNDYLNQIQTKLQKHQLQSCRKLIQKKKSQINNTNISKYNPKQFELDSLRAKNQKLKEKFNLLNKQKQELGSKISLSEQKYGVKYQLNDVVQGFLSKFKFSIQDIHKIQLQFINISSDYSKFYISSHEQSFPEQSFQSHGQSFKSPGQSLKIQQIQQFKIQPTLQFKMQSIQELQTKYDKKGYFLLFQTYNKNKDQIYLILKFKNQINHKKWYNCFLFGKLLQQSKNKRYLFLPTNTLKSDINQIFIDSQFPQQKLTIQQSDKLTSQKNSIAPSNKNYIVDNPMYNTLLVARHNVVTNVKKNMSSSFIIENNNVQKKQSNYSNYRPSPLNRIRGKTMYQQFGNRLKNSNRKDKPQQTSFDISQIKDILKHNYGNNLRKTSQDITLRPKNPSHYQKQLQKFRSQRSLVDDIILQAQKSKQSKRIQQQIDKKNQFLQRSKEITNQPLKVNQQGQIKSKGSNLRQRVNRFQEQEMYILEDPESLSSMKDINQESEAREISPTFPTKIKYDDGSHIRLHPVEGQVQNLQKQAFHNQFSQRPSNKNIQLTNQFTDTANLKNQQINNTKLQVSTKKQQLNTKKQQLNTKKEQANKDKQEVNKDKQEVNTKKEYQRKREQQKNRQDAKLNGLQKQGQQSLQSILLLPAGTLESQQSSHNFTQSNSQSHQQQAFQILLQQLKKGLVLTKCAENGFWTREKQLKLSQNQNTLLVIDVKDKKIRKVRITDVIAVQYGKYGKGVVKHVTQIEQRKCLMITVTQGNQDKKLQFVGNNPEKLQLFANDFQYFVQTFKST